MADRWSGMAHAVVHSNPPAVYVAENIDVLQRVLALRVIAQRPAAKYPPGVADRVREALLDEQWGVALAGWIEATGIPVDVYDDLDVWTADRLAEGDLGLIELQFTPLFRD